MKERQKQILKAVVKEYQKTSQPVASEVLSRKYRFNFSPATVRLEMLALNREGFLEQPHTSAGRVPTDKAFRFFIKESEEETSGGEREKIWRRMKELHEESMKEMARFLADCTGNFGFSGFLGRAADFHGSGFRWLTEEPEFADEDLKDIMKRMDSLEDDFNKFFSDLDEETEIFIGRENPIKYLRNCSLMVTGFKKAGSRGVLGILGPKRMNYRKNKLVLEETKKKISGSAVCFKNRNQP